MPKTRKETSKKHGDKLEPFIERTGGTAAPEDETREEQAAPDPTELQDDDDEDVQNDDVEQRRDVGRPH